MRAGGGTWQGALEQGHGPSGFGGGRWALGQRPRPYDEYADEGYGRADDDNDDKTVGTMTTPAHDHDTATTGSKDTTTKEKSTQRTMTYETYEEGDTDDSRKTMDR